MWGVHSDFRGCCTAAWARNRRESRNGSKYIC
ncbi:hypothetical protein Gotur_033609 [Gossypium turneri]